MRRSTSQQLLVSHYSLNALKARSWTPALIDRFLGQPDQLATNPKVRSGAKMQLYYHARVHAAEALPEFAAARARAAPRKRAAARAVETKKRDTIATAASIKIHMPALSLDELARRAAQHYDARRSRRMRPDDEDEGATTFPPWDSPSPFRDRLCVNFLRHELTPYEDALALAIGRVGRDEARRVIFRRVVDAIAAQYPGLSAECQRQYAERFGGAP